MTQSSSENPQQRKTGMTMIVIAWLILFALIALYFDDWLGEQANPNQNPAVAHTGKNVEVTLLPNRQHHYVVSGTINGHAVTFILDTGATDVVLPAALADRIGLPRGQPKIANTANGRVTVYSTVLDSVKIADIQLADIRASINPGMDGNTVLLGMSALRQIEFAQRGETLILRQ